MQTAEIIIYLSIAVIVGGILVGFLVGMDTQSMYNTINSLFSREKTTTYQNLDAREVAPAVFNFWQDCGYGTFNKTLILGLNEDEELNKTVLFDSIIKYNLCYSIQWNESTTLRCGDRDDVAFEDHIEGPTLLNIHCDNTTRRLNITELT